MEEDTPMKFQGDRFPKEINPKFKIRKDSNSLQVDYVSKMTVTVA